MWTELLRALAYSFAGLVVGFFIGSAWCRTRVLHMVEKHDSIKGVSDSRYLGIILVALGLLTTGMSAAASWQAQEQARCFSAYNQEFVQAYTARSIAADKDRSSLNNLIFSIDSPNRQVRADALRTYIVETRKTDDERRRNPIPQPPDPNKYCERH